MDLLGKTDLHVAAEASRVPGGARRFMDFRPGHTKYDDAYSIGELRPDIIVQLWGSTDEARPYLDGSYRTVGMLGHCVEARLGSPNIMWTAFDYSACSLK